MASTPALLALKRFIRGPLRQFGLGMVSFLLIFNMTTYLSVVVDNTSVEQHSRRDISTTRSVAEVPDTQRLETVGEFGLPGITNDSTVTHSVLTRPAITPKPRRVLSPKMTGHRLTGARFSLPLTNRQAIASLSEDK